MKWIDGNELDTSQFSGKELCEKLSTEMYDLSKEQRLQCDAVLQNAMLIIDFDTETSMEGFSTPYIGNFTADDYARIINAFREIGDTHDAEILSEALRLDAEYTGLLERTDTDGYDRIYDEFCDQLDKLEQELYLNTDFDMWAMLFRYLDEQLGRQ